MSNHNFGFVIGVIVWGNCARIGDEIVVEGSVACQSIISYYGDGNHIDPWDNLDGECRLGVSP